MRLPWAVVLLSLLAGRYLHWRVVHTLNLEDRLSASLSLLTLAAECLLLFTSFLQLWFTLAPPAPAPTPKALGPAPSGALPSVDVLVPTYGEPPALIERCLRGCLALDYPDKQVWLLDDSGRSELEALCQRLGCHYLARNERRHAKAGNLNHALHRCSADLIAVFDADVVPLHPFLLRTAPLFADPTVGFVQTPQTYMNADPVMRNLGMERWLMPDEESFYRWIEPTRMALGGVVCAGTSFVMRRQALDRVGGFETGTPSEDLATGIKVAAAGYRNIYLKQKLSAGLAPFTAAAMARQRCRWCSGTLQVLRTQANPLTIAGLSVWQRLAYLEGILHWFNVLPQMVLLLMPLSLGLLGVAPILLTGKGLLTYAVPFYLTQLLLVRWFSDHSRTALLPELYRWIFLVPLCGAVLATLVNRPLTFRVTPKALPVDRRTGPDRRLQLPLLFLLSLQAITLVNLVPGVTRLPGAMRPLSPATMAAGIGWAVLNGLVLLLALRCCRDREGGDGVPWFSLRWPVRLLSESGRVFPAEVRAISEHGVELALERCTPTPLPGDRLALEELVLPLTVVGVRLGPAVGLGLGATWTELDAGQRERLQTLLYRRAGLWPLVRARFEGRALPLVLWRLLRPVPLEGWFRRSLIPQEAPSPLMGSTGDAFQPSSRQARPYTS